MYRKVAVDSDFRESLGTVSPSVKRFGDRHGSPLSFSSSLFRRGARDRFLDPLKLADAVERPLGNRSGLRHARQRTCVGQAPAIRLT
jgi:hypothetical protein